jgi:hypothetical protein
MRRQIRRTGRIFFILLIICDDIFVSFHPLVQDEIDNTVDGMLQPGLFINTCYTGIVRSSHPLELFSFGLLDRLHMTRRSTFLVRNPAGFELERPAGIHE